MKIKIKRKLAISGIAFAFLVLLLFITLGSCQISYLAQAVAGHMRVMHARQPIKKVLKDDRIDQKTKDKLRLVLDIHDFAIRDLGLPSNKSYTLYSDIGEDYLGWNVFCAPRFSVEPKTWCYPIAGCVVYHGYFKKEKAVEFAGKMKKEGLEVYVSPFSAYSTLGWYKDPILSTQLRYDSIDLAGLIIHEMAHQELYKSGDSRFNEGFAVTVERAGVLRWLGSLGRQDQIARANKEWKEEDRRVDLMLRARDDLKELYQMNRDTAFLLKQKDSILSGLERELEITGRKMNNAWLIPISTYHSLIPRFQGILDSCGGDFRTFYEKVKLRKEL